MRRPTRREVLASGAVAGAGAIGIASYVDPFGPSTGPLSPWKWLYVPEDVDGNGYRYTHWNVGSLDGDGSAVDPSVHAREWPTLTRNDFEHVLWADPEEVDEFLLLNQPEYSFSYQAYGDEFGDSLRDSSAQVIGGTEQYVESVRSRVETWVEESDWSHESYRGFDLYGTRTSEAVALGSVDGRSVVVRSNFIYPGDGPPDHEILRTLLDVRTGSTRRLQDADDAAEGVQGHLTTDGVSVGTVGAQGRFERLLGPIDRGGEQFSLRRAGLNVTREGERVRFELVVATDDPVADPAGFANRLPLLDPWEVGEIQSDGRVTRLPTTVSIGDLGDEPATREHPLLEFEFEFDDQETITIRHTGGWSIPTDELLVDQFAPNQDGGGGRSHSFRWTDRSDSRYVTEGDAITIDVEEGFRGELCQVIWSAWLPHFRSIYQETVVAEAAIPE